LNQLKTKVQEAVKTHKAQLEQKQEGAAATDDLTKPASFTHAGSRHPVSLVLREILDIYASMGFAIAEGPEIEDDRHVFSALNFAPDHPARDMQDTFFINHKYRQSHIVTYTHQFCTSADHGDKDTAHSCSLSREGV